jgi:DHA3 family tetracycline resistance protein-like MFS transporter
MTAERIYLISGLIRRACSRGYWPLLFVRLVTEVELSALELVLLGTVMELTILTMEIPTGVVADVYSRKWSVVISFLVMGVAMALSGLFEPYALLVATQVLIGFGNTFETGAETAWITAELGGHEAAEPVILRRARLQLLAGVVGIVGFAGLAAITSLTAALVVIGAIYVGWSILLAVVMPETNFERSRGEGWRAFTGMLADGYGQARRINPLRVLVIVVFIGGLAKEAIDRLDVQRLVDVGLPNDIDEVLVIGLITAVKLLVASALLFAAHRRVGETDLITAMAVLLFGVAVGVLLLAQVDVLGVAALGLILQGGFHFATEPVVTTWTNRFASDDARATVHSFMGQAEAFGEIVGGIALGVVAQVISVPAAMTVSGVLFLVAAATTLRARTGWDAAAS